jgi:hypothetical protein
MGRPKLLLDQGGPRGVAPVVAPQKHATGRVVGAAEIRRCGETKLRKIELLRFVQKVARKLLELYP